MWIVGRELFFRRDKALPCLIYARIDVRFPLYPNNKSDVDSDGKSDGDSDNKLDVDSDSRSDGDSDNKLDVDSDSRSDGDSDNKLDGDETRQCLVSTKNKTTIKNG